ncbi:hypothetical protein C8A03DRAFT_37122 [Achaetomium macrosporum]|uniref:Uncharacterized protein n=1 Tax=Achaetomium macrosporum TaxID=79813 RepID=A0AAN7C497_9PEZI|nr:hypothetical protein C8A03DRAFT_37122 [Achaetomium macrosporum]
MPSKQLNPPSAAVLKKAMAEIVERKKKTQENLDKTKEQLRGMQSKNASLTAQTPLKDKIRRLEAEVQAWPTTYETEVKRWLLSQPSVQSGGLPTLPQEIKNEISGYLSTTRIAQIEREVLKKEGQKK